MQLLEVGEGSSRESREVKGQVAGRGGGWGGADYKWLAEGCGCAVKVGLGGCGGF